MTVITTAQEGASALAEVIRGAERILAFTGAGISTECGVPDFRSPGSPWMVNKPIPYEAFLASAEVRREAWRRKFTMDDHYRGARPGRGHRALARLHEEGRLIGVVTQNIDGLHLASGIPAERIVELHGNGTYATCLDCGLRHELADIRPVFEATGAAPVCQDCRGPVKSATVSFGQAMPEQAMRKALAMVAACDVFIAIGSSLVVQPAARLPVMARQTGAELVILNGEPTPVDAVSNLVVRADIGDVLEAATVPQ
ncbi:Sir2 family NAD-dependent protein deacetylase [uncultured Alsobacter sp.]|uniref:SIR2 family NAD-dependent protein deacylase n=1 Tax=uncultured Alsobacter sp. TaxID=1748258 RepID=UPI0025D32EE1|nr:Sir2 family NAD-dependent protein deacetylase [uncultured Alsobacter sp.]